MAKQKLPAPTLATPSRKPPIAPRAKPIRERLGGTLDMAALKALRGPK